MEPCVAPAVTVGGAARKEQRTGEDVRRNYLNGLGGEHLMGLVQGVTETGLLFERS